MNTKLRAFANAEGLPTQPSVTAGQVSDDTGVVARPGGLPKKDSLLADRGHDAGWFGDALKDRGLILASRAGPPAAHPPSTTGAVTGSRSCSAGSRTGDGMPPAVTGARKVFLSAITLAAAAMVWP